jgi:hypothetical protein
LSLADAACPCNIIDGSSLLQLLRDGKETQETKETTYVQANLDVPFPCHVTLVSRIMTTDNRKWWKPACLDILDFCLNVNPPWLGITLRTFGDLAGMANNTQAGPKPGVAGYHGFTFILLIELRESA